MQINEDRVVKQFIELVGIDSETKDEAEISNYLKNLFSELGLEVEEDTSKERTGHGANNLICTLRGTGAGPTIFFTCHMDTVVPGKNIKPLITDGYLHTDGTTILGADDKAGIAALIEAIRTIQEQDIPHNDVQFIITVGEESGLIGAKEIDKELIEALFGYALDSDGPVGNMVVQAPAQAKLNVQIIGKTAHAGLEPEKGVSAITVAGKVIAALPMGRIDAETTANIGSIRGGEQTNIVCDYVQIESEARSLSKSRLEELVKIQVETIKKVVSEENAEAIVEVKDMYPAYHVEEDMEVVQLAKRAAKNIRLESNLLSSGGGSDANIFSGYGLPTINLALGYEYIHTVNERIKITYLQQAAALTVAIITEATKQ